MQPTVGVYICSSFRQPRSRYSRQWEYPAHRREKGAIEGNLAPTALGIMIPANRISGSGFSPGSIAIDGNPGYPSPKPDDNTVGKRLPPRIVEPSTLYPFTLCTALHSSFRLVEGAGKGSHVLDVKVQTPRVAPSRCPTASDTLRPAVVGAANRLYLAKRIPERTYAFIALSAPQIRLSDAVWWLRGSGSTYAIVCNRRHCETIARSIRFRTARDNSARALFHRCASIEVPDPWERVGGWVPLNP